MSNDTPDVDTPTRRENLKYSGSAVIQSDRAENGLAAKTGTDEQYDTQYVLPANTKAPDGPADFDGVELVDYGKTSVETDERQDVSVSRCLRVWRRR